MTRRHDNNDEDDDKDDDDEDEDEDNDEDEDDDDGVVGKDFQELCCEATETTFHVFLSAC